MTLLSFLCREWCRITQKSIYSLLQHYLWRAFWSRLDVYSCICPTLNSSITIIRFINAEHLSHPLSIVHLTRKHCSWCLNTQNCTRKMKERKREKQNRKSICSSIARGKSKHCLIEFLSVTAVNYFLWHFYHNISALTLWLMKYPISQEMWTTLLLNEAKGQPSFTWHKNVMGAYWLMNSTDALDIIVLSSDVQSHHESVKTNQRQTECS